MTRQRETVELIGGEIYFSDDHWVTVYKAALGGLGGGRKVIGKQADRVRLIAVIQHGGGPNDAARKKGKR